MASQFKDLLNDATKQLSKSDAILAAIISRHGNCTISPHNDYYWSLIDSIISQQLSVKAASTIEARFQELLGAKVPSPQAIVKKSIDDLRSIGLSRAKANYIRDLAQSVIDGTVKFDSFNSLTNQQIIDELVKVKGIGEWTAHMFLIFCMGRLDVLPTGDLGIRKGISQLYKLDSIATPQQVREVANSNHWAPYESVASWYIWRSLDNLPALE